MPPPPVLRKLEDAMETAERVLNNVESMPLGYDQDVALADLERLMDDAGDILDDIEEQSSLQNQS